MPTAQTTKRHPRLGRALIATLAIAALVLGFFGQLQYLATKQEHYSVLDAFYGAIRLFLFESDGFLNPPWQLDIARFLAPAVAAWSAVLAAMALFGEQWQERRLRRATKHVVVCGLGAKGERLAAEFLATGDTVVVIESNPDNPALKRLQARGALAAIGSATEAGILRQSRAHRAALVIAVCGRDEVNVAIAVHVQDFARSVGRPPGNELRCFVHVVDPDLALLLQRQDAFAAGEGCEIQLFDAYFMAARRFLATHPLELGLQGSSDPRHVHLIILGFGQLGRSLMLQAVRAGSFANLKPIRITIVDRDGDAVRRRIRANFPQIDQACSVDVISGAIEDPEVLDRLTRIALQPDELRTFAVCLDDDGRALTAALRVRAALAEAGPNRLAVRLAASGELGRLLRGAATGSPGAGEVVVLGTHAEGCGRDELLGGTLDVLAMAIHADYVAKRMAQGHTALDPNLFPWWKLAPNLKDSCRSQADHMPIKLRAIGCRPAPGISEVGFSFTDQEVEVLARMEHARWVAERILDGWTLGPKDVKARRTPHLLSWEELAEDVREWDREPVRNIPNLLGAVGQHVERESA